MTKQKTPSAEAHDFSLVLGGPLYQLWRRTHLLGAPLNLLVRRVIVSSLLVWLPLVPLAYFSGNSLTGGKVPFVFDFVTHARFLLALPLLIIAEVLVHERLFPLVKQFRDRDLIEPEERGHFDHILDSTHKLRNSMTVEVLLLLMVFTLGHLVWRYNTPTHLGTWYASEVGGKISLNVAGYWYAFVSVPIFQFLLFRWYYRLFLWYRLLWKVARLKLCLEGNHPDRAGGIGFLGSSALAFAPVLLAHTVLLAGFIGNHLWHEGAVLTDFKNEIVFILFILVLVPILPLFFFIPQLLRKKRTSRRQMGIFAMQYVRDFDQKWMQNKTQKSPLGTSDIQSLSDLANSYDVMNAMRLLPIGRNTVVMLFLVLAMPILPLVLTMVPLGKMIDKAFGILF